MASTESDSLSDWRERAPARITRLHREPAGRTPRGCYAATQLRCTGKLIQAMGRRRTQNKHLLPRMHIKGRTYWHVGTSLPRKWTKLDTEWPIALRKYAEIEGSDYPENDVTFRAIAQRYRRKVFPTKAPQTQFQNEAELKRLDSVFGDMPIDAIKPHHVRLYLDKRGEKAPVRANREKALLSHIFNWAREWGYTDRANPCAGVKGHRETGRDRYVTDAEFRAVWECAHFTVQDAMEVAYYTAQRPADVLRIRRSDIKEGALHIQQRKTGKRIRILIKGPIAQVVERINSRPRTAIGPTLIQEANGQPLSPFALRSRFDKARERAKVTFQFRDIRAKAASDLTNLSHAQKLLGHKRRDMTEHYAGRRIGEAIEPVVRPVSDTE